MFVALRFYATGSLFYCASELHGCSIATCSRVVRRVSRLLCHLRNRHIRFPSTPAAVAETQRDLFAMAGFPQLVGIVDATHVCIHGCKLDNEHVYVNRKGRHSLNIQVVCDAHYKIANVSARWPGSTHDSRILENSRLGQLFQQGQMQGILLADSGYALHSWLMTPVANPTSDRERAYNR